MPNTATALVIGGFATGLGLATLLVLPGQAPPVSAGTPAAPVAPAPVPPADTAAPRLILAQTARVVRPPERPAPALRKAAAHRR